MKTDFDIAIVGGGMIGASLAIALSKLNCRVLLIEAQSITPQNMVGESGYEPRVSAITEASKNWLTMIGVWESISPEKISGYTSMDVWDEEGTGNIQFDAIEIGHPELGSIVENSEIQKALAAQLQQSPVQIIEKARVVKIDNLLTTNSAETAIASTEHLVELDDGYKFSCQLIVGADGHNSKVRELAGFDTVNWQYNHQAIVTTITTEAPHNHCARQSFAQSGPLGVLPLAGNQQKCCSIVWSQTPERAQQLMAMDDNEFCHSIGRALEHRLGKVISVDKRYAIPLVPSLSKQYVKPGIAIIGDAAHRIHPLAGQGANLGFLDAQALYDNIAESLNKELPLGDLMLLRKFQRNRQAHNLAMTAAMESFKRLFEANHIGIRWIRNFGMNKFNQMSWLKNELARFAMGLGESIFSRPER